jgi:hypothetical protein
LSREEIRAGARLVSLNAGKPRALVHRGKSVPSGIFKTPVSKADAPRGATCSRTLEAAK